MTHPSRTLIYTMALAPLPYIAWLIAYAPRPRSAAHAFDLASYGTEPTHQKITHSFLCVRTQPAHQAGTAALVPAYDSVAARRYPSRVHLHRHTAGLVTRTGPSSAASSIRACHRPTSSETVRRLCGHTAALLRAVLHAPKKLLVF